MARTSKTSVTAPAPATSKAQAAAPVATKRGPGRPKAQQVAAPAPESNGNGRAPRALWTEPRVAIVKALRAAKAVSANKALNSADLAVKAGLDEAAIKHYCYKNQKLVTEGYVAIAQGEELPPEYTGRLGYYLTANGRTTKMAD